MRMSDFILGCSYERIRKTVVLAPCWLPESVGIDNCKLISEKTCKIWDCSMNDSRFTYVVTGVGAASCMDVVLALGETLCRRILFLGSAGSLKKEDNIGDFAVPSGIISAEGASRYLGVKMNEDVFGTMFHPNAKMQERMYNCLKRAVESEGIKVHEGVGISVESIYLQYRHIEEMGVMSCRYIDMESSAFLAATNYLGIDSVVVFCISDNVASGESLKEVSKEKTQFRKNVRKAFLPFVIESYINCDVDGG